MLGSGNTTPYDFPVLIALGAFAILLLVGCFLGQGWPSPSGTIVRRGAIILALLLVAVVYVVTPSPSGIEGAARMLTLWPALGVNALLFAIWSWRVGQL